MAVLEDYLLFLDIAISVLSSLVLCNPSNSLTPSLTRPSSEIYKANVAVSFYFSPTTLDLLFPSVPSNPSFSSLVRYAMYTNKMLLELLQHHTNFMQRVFLSLPHPQ